MTLALELNLTCGNRECSKHIDNKCSVWKKPRHICKDFLSPFQQIAHDMASFNMSHNLKSGVHISSITEEIAVPSRETIVTFGGRQCGKAAKQVYDELLNAIRRGNMESKTSEEQLKELQTEALTVGVIHQGLLVKIQNLHKVIREEKASKVKKLFLQVGEDHRGEETLLVYFGTESEAWVVARLNDDRTFEALSGKGSLAAYTEWAKDQKQVDFTHSVVYGDRVYKLSEKGGLYSIHNKGYINSKYKQDNDYQRIYDFRSALPCVNCGDPNIITTDHNNRVVIF
jgi:tRNA splicing endonuclease